MMNAPLYKNTKNFKGQGADRFPVFLSWVVFTYTVDSGYFSYLTNLKNFSEKSEFNKGFDRDNAKYFPKDLGFYEKNLGKHIVLPDRSRCVYYYSTNMPYTHDILIDTVDYRVVHLVSGVRD